MRNIFAHSIHPLRPSIPGSLLILSITVVALSLHLPYRLNNKWLVGGGAMIQLVANPKVTINNEETFMQKTLLTSFVATLLMVGSFISLSAQVDRQVTSVESVRIKVDKLGVGEKAKATVRMKDGTKIKGYISQAGEDSFVIRDRKTDAPTTIRYVDVLKVEENRGHSTARNIGIGVGVGVGAVLAVVAILIASLD